MKHLDLFSGIGGFALAARWVGIETIGFSEVDPFCCKVLAKNFPGVPNYGDITQLDGRAIAADLITAGVPCQPASLAGKRRGAQDDRWLWPEALRVVREVKPAWVMFENPVGFITLNGGMEFERTLTSLEEENYETQAVIIPACSLDAAHERYRVFIIAHTEKPRSGRLPVQSWGSQQTYPHVDGSSQAFTHTHGDDRQAGQVYKSSGQSPLEPGPATTFSIDADVTLSGRSDLQGQCPTAKTPRWQELAPALGRLTEPALLRRVHGVSRGMDRHRIKALGNAIVPQVAAVILEVIVHIGKEQRRIAEDK